jgi:hypothetical protein
VSDPSGVVVLNNISSNSGALWDFSLTNVGAAPTTNYCFRIVYADDTLLEEYDSYPEVVTSENAYLDLTAQTSVSVNMDVDRVSSGAGTAMVSTNAKGSYSLTLNASGTNNNLTHTVYSSYNIPALGSQYTPTAPTSLSGGTSQWGFRLDGWGSFGTGTTAETNLASSAYTWASVPISSAPVQIGTGTATDNRGIGGSNNSNIRTVFYGFSSSANQVAGQYQTNVVYTAVVDP